MEEEPEKKKPKKRWGKQALEEEPPVEVEEEPEKSAIGTRGTSIVDALLVPTNSEQGQRHESGNLTAIWRPGNNGDSIHFVEMKGKWNPGSRNTLVQLASGVIRNVPSEQLYPRGARLKPSHKAPARRWGKRGAEEEQKAGETG